VGCGSVAFVRLPRDPLQEELIRLSEKFLVKTDYGEVVVQVNPRCENALENDLLLLSSPTEQEKAEFVMETPLRAFGAKMIDIIRTIGTGRFDPGAGVREMLIKEKATSDLNRIERWARDRTGS
jgi:hypothetical protein